LGVVVERCATPSRGRLEWPTKADCSLRRCLLRSLVRIAASLLGSYPSPQKLRVLPRDDLEVLQSLAGCPLTLRRADESAIAHATPNRLIKPVEAPAMKPRPCPEVRAIRSLHAIGVEPPAGEGRLDVESSGSRNPHLVRAAARSCAGGRAGRACQ
jgi:hypothetical protein